MKNNQILPSGFKTWLQLYRELKKNSLMDEETISFNPFDSMSGPGGVSQMQIYDVAYIKAKCFDELKDIAFTIPELETILHALINNQQTQRGDILDRKIKDSIENLYQLGEYV